MPIHEKGYGLVLHRFWGDTLRENWTEDERMLGLYLMTNEHRTLEGFYNLRFDYAAFDLKWERRRLDENLNSLASKGFIAFDAVNEAILILKTLKVISPDTPLQAKGLSNRATNVRCSDELRTQFLASLKEFAPTIFERHANAIGKALPSHLSLSLGALPEAGTDLDYSREFLAAWEIFPDPLGRSGKKASFVLWQKLGLDRHADNVLAWIRSCASSPDWTKDGGQFVPGMQVWLKKHDFSEPPPSAVSLDAPAKQPRCPECGHLDFKHEPGACLFAGGGQCDCEGSRG